MEYYNENKSSRRSMSTLYVLQIPFDPFLYYIPLIRWTASKIIKNH